MSDEFFLEFFGYIPSSLIVQKDEVSKLIEWFFADEKEFANEKLCKYPNSEECEKIMTQLENLVEVKFEEIKPINHSDDQWRYDYCRKLAFDSIMFWLRFPTQKHYTPSPYTSLPKTNEFPYFRM